ncbi:MAG: sulfatase-like hydrolase/transferase [Proteobacteria bacterium]|nr:sulfatase-like hydrolase/transferase [Pseudomonadota bacterium]MDA0992524.1 sulfatase-like hydrolase/transferase [Pseudomonadota bacterium]
MARVALLVFCAAMSVAASAADNADRPNIVLIISDYMGYHDTEPYGATDVRTPSILRLASEGVTMTDFYAAAPVCGPSRAALFTGQYPARIGFEQNIRGEADGLSSTIPSLPRWLKNAGYRTALLGKWHLGRTPDLTPNAHGFDEFIGHHEWTIGYYNHKTEQGKPGLFENDHIVERDGYLTDLLTDEAVKFIDRNQDRPFFLTLSYNAALPPYQPPGLPESKWGEGWDVNQATRDDYVQMVERMDEGIGRVLDTLDTRGLTSNTLVVYMYDHGGRHLVNSEPLFHGFASLWEGGIRIPTILRLPGVIPSNERSNIPGIAMDLTATILSVAGIEDTATKLDGLNLIPALRDEQPPPTRQLFWRADLYDFGKQKAIRDKNWKYVEHGNTQFLFDLNVDAGERHNLFYRQPDTVKRLRNDLNTWIESLARE